MKAETDKLGLSARQVKDRRHALVQKVVLAAQAVEPAGQPQQRDVFSIGAKWCTPAFAGELRDD